MVATDLSREGAITFFGDNNNEGMKKSPFSVSEIGCCHCRSSFFFGSTVNEDVKRKCRWHLITNDDNDVRGRAHHHHQHQQAFLTPPSTTSLHNNNLKWKTGEYNIVNAAEQVNSLPKCRKLSIYRETHNLSIVIIITISLFPPNCLSYPIPSG